MRDQKPQDTLTGVQGLPNPGCHRGCLAGSLSGGQADRPSLASFLSYPQSASGNRLPPGSQRHQEKSTPFTEAATGNPFPTKMV